MSLIVQPPSRFKAATSQTLPVAKKPGTQAQASPRFGAGFSPNQVAGLAKRLDFKEIGQSSLEQLQLIYGVCILWRWGAAWYRGQRTPTKSNNEIRETVLRDSLGFSFWFFATPILQRLFLKRLAPKDVSKSLLEKTANPDKSGVRGFFRNLNHQWNPLSRYAIPSSRQVNDGKIHALRDLLKTDGITTASPQYKALGAHYDKLIKYRNLATATGLGATILLIGIGINLFNVYLTRKNSPANRLQPHPGTGIPTGNPLLLPVLPRGIPATQPLNSTMPFKPLQAYNPALVGTPTNPWAPPVPLNSTWPSNPYAH